MNNMKPILFNTEMVRAILAARKTVTRRVVKPRYCDSVFEVFDGNLCEVSPYKPPIRNEDGTTTHFIRTYESCKPPHQPIDILYVRETWNRLLGEWIYKADQKPGFKNPGKWCPSIHMPREAARIFLRVTDVRVERLQDITEEQAQLEGAKKEYQHYYDNVITAREVFQGIWDSTIKPADRALYGWDANPWVWVIEFERCEKPGGD